jgi:hypothetical protein
VIHAFNHGLGDTAGSVRFYVPSFTGSVAASQQVLFPDDQNEEVECLIVPLDTFVHEQGIDRVDLIKCDVEGSELLVLRGGMASIERHKPVIMLEMLRKWSRRFGYHPNDIIALLGGSGYQCWSFRDGGFTEVPSVDDACTETNFFFLHADRHKPLLAEMAHARHTPRSASES